MGAKFKGCDGEHRWGSFQEEGVHQGMGCIICGAWNDNHRENRVLPASEWVEKFWSRMSPVARTRILADGC